MKNPKNKGPDLLKKVGNVLGFVPIDQKDTVAVSDAVPKRAQDPDLVEQVEEGKKLIAQKRANSK